MLGWDNNKAATKTNRYFSQKGGKNIGNYISTVFYVRVYLHGGIIWRNGNCCVDNYLWFFTFLRKISKFFCCAAIISYVPKHIQVEFMLILSILDVLFWVMSRTDPSVDRTRRDNDTEVTVQATVCRWDVSMSDWLTVLPLDIINCHFSIQI